MSWRSRCPRERTDKFPLFEVAELRLATGVFPAGPFDDEEHSGVACADTAPSQTAAIQEHDDSGKNFANRQHLARL
jgi:hypothetical protein